MPIDRLFELYPIWTVLAAVGAFYCLNLARKAINDFIELRRKRNEAAIDDTIQFNRIKRLSLVEQHQKTQQELTELKKSSVALSTHQELKDKYEQLGVTAKYHQDLNDAQSIEIAYLKPLADNAERMQAAFDLQTLQVSQQSEEIAKVRDAKETAATAYDATIKKLMLDLDICYGVIHAGQIGDGIKLIQLEDLEIDKDN